jgi:hypothetical protein
LIVEVRFREGNVLPDWVDPNCWRKEENILFVEGGVSKFRSGYEVLYDIALAGIGWAEYEHSEALFWIRKEGMRERMFYFILFMKIDDG